MAEETKVGEEGDHWMQTKWRPAMGWMYMTVCTCDFVVFPVLWSLLQAMTHGSVSSQWQPITLQGAGLFHVAMGAVLGIAAFGRTQEKIAGTAGNVVQPINTPTPTVPTTSDFTPTYQPQQSHTIVTGFGGKPAPAPAAQQLL
jgi:hypothetical protein